ncbi:MAG: hypothetical protein Q9193_003258 [Seirophora villosa]
MTCLTLADDPDQQELWRTTVVKHGLSHPFLLHEILAIAALHLATCIPEEKGLLTTQATELQNYAVGKFHEIEVTDETNCIAVMLFSSLLGVHLLADRSRTQGLGFSDFLDHVLRCMGLLRGVMELTLKEWTSFFQASDIAPLIRDGRPQAPYDNIPEDCRDLLELVKQSDLGPSSVTAYNAAIDRLFWLFALSDVPTVHSTTRWAIGWPVQLPDEYIVLLNQRRPEALIILSYYGVILHFNREAWIIGDTGARLVRAINSQRNAKNFAQTRLGRDTRIGQEHAFRGPHDDGSQRQHCFYKNGSVVPNFQNEHHRTKPVTHHQILQIAEKPGYLDSYRYYFSLLRLGIHQTLVWSLHLATMADEHELYQYTPSLAPAVIAIVVFTVLSALHTYRMIRSRLWFCLPFTIGGVCQYTTLPSQGPRILLENTRGRMADQVYILQLSSLAMPAAPLATPAPALFAATIYMTLGRIIRATHAETYSPIRVTWLTKLFVFGDVLSFCTQGAGGGQSASGDPDKVELGENIILGGLFLQITIFGLFVLVSIIFHMRLRKQPTGESLSKDLSWQKMMGSLYVVSALILVRNIFRVVEYIGGRDGPLLRVEWPIYVFDALLMAATMAVWGFWYPTLIRPRESQIGAVEDGIPLPNVQMIARDCQSGPATKAGRK